MGELWEHATRIYNFPLTLMLGIVLCYWMLTIFGIFDSDSFDPDLSVDADIDVDLDMDVDVDADFDVAAGGHGHGHVEVGGLGMMRFFGLGDIPLMVLLTVLILSMWVIAILANYVINPGGSILIAIALLIPNFIVSLFVMKYTTIPLKPFYRALRTDSDAPEPVVGRTGTVRSSEITESFGQIEVGTKGTPLYLNARIAAGDEPLKKGDEGLIYKFNKDSGIYMIRKSKLVLTETQTEETL